MAHLIKLTDHQSNEPVLYNLDTVVSIERIKDFTVITTRWGRNQVVESLEYIQATANGSDVTEVAPPF